MLVAVGLAVPAVGKGPVDGWLLVGLGGGGLLCLAGGLAVRWSAALAAGIALLGAEQAVRLATGPAHADPWTPLYAAGFLSAAELAWWSIEPRVPAFSELPVLVNRLVVIALACAGGAARKAPTASAAASLMWPGRCITRTRDRPLPQNL